MRPAALTVGELIACFDLCTSEHLDKTFGRDATEEYAFLEQYRTTFRETTAARVFICSGRSFKIGEGEAMSYLQNHRLVFLPFVEPETSCRDILPIEVTQKIYLRIYSHVLYLLWQHLRTFGSTEDTGDAAVISFQDVSELSACRDVFSRTCAPLLDVHGKQLLIPIKKILLSDLERFYVPR